MDKERLIFLKELKEYWIKNNIPNISETNAKLLHFLIKTKQSKNILEIWCANWYSTIWIADALEQIWWKLTTCDVSAPSFEQGKKNIKEVWLEKIVNFKFGNGNILFKNSKEKFDFVFIDAQKSEYHNFWKTIKPLLTNNAIIFVDDVLKFPTKTKAFYEIIENDKDYEFCVLPIDEDDGTMLIQKKKMY